MREEYQGSITVAFDEMPAIKLEPYLADKDAGLIERLSIATKRRRFTLQDDWTIELGDLRYAPELNGTVVIPKTDKNKKPNVFDGASVPLPWLVSLLTIGILRPLGVMLIGSIVHDYAFTHGSLRVKSRSGELVDVGVERHHADRLFKDIIGTVNKLPPLGYVAWLAVRLGWVGVKYAGKPRTGDFPAFAFLFVGFIISLAFYVASIFSFKALLIGLLIGYLLFYVVSLQLQKRYKYNPSSDSEKV